VQTGWRIVKRPSPEIGSSLDVTFIFVGTTPGKHQKDSLGECNIREPEINLDVWLIGALITIPKGPPVLHPLKMASYTSKVQRTANAPAGPADEIEKTVAQAILDLETNVPELKSELQQLAISAAKEVDVKGGKKAIVIFVPVPMLKAFHKVQAR
jgi:hypothetical protein